MELGRDIQVGTDKFSIWLGRVKWSSASGGSEITTFPHRLLHCFCIPIRCRLNLYSDGNEDRVSDEPVRLIKCPGMFT